MTETRTKVLLAAALTLLSGHGLADESGKVEELYVKSCAVCHAAGAAGAPKTGDVAQWEPRLAKGMDTLVTNVQTGLNAMPPKGMCFNCSPEDYKALIEYMAKPQ
ncbi:MAG: c-type cytochrome [Halieaceae bacterium]|nr:c-type cytochrome [Halieaceae bacterium]